MEFLKQLQAATAERAQLAAERDALWAELDTILAADMVNVRREREVRARIEELQSRLFVIDQERSVADICMQHARAGRDFDINAIRASKRLPPV